MTLGFSTATKTPPVIPASPLRYPGGKGKLSSFFQRLVYLNKLDGGTYVEPFAGGAAVGVELLARGVVGNVVLNDVDRSVWCFWKSALSHTDSFVTEIERVPLTVKEWRRQRSIQRDPDASLFALGFSTFYLNRTNRSGVIDGGVIGGLKQNGPYLIDARFNREGLIKRIRQAGDLGDQIELYNLDAEDFIQEVLPETPQRRTLVYFDPPYYGVSQSLYTSHYKNDDHKRLAKAINSSPRHWCVSYNDVPQVRAFYERLRSRSLLLDYSLHDRRKGEEVMFFSHGLSIPRKITASG